MRAGFSSFKEYRIGCHTDWLFFLKTGLRDPFLENMEASPGDRLARFRLPPYRNLFKNRSERPIFEKLEASPGIGPGIKVLQTSALPLGYDAVDSKSTLRSVDLL